MRSSLVLIGVCSGWVPPGDRGNSQDSELAWGEAAWGSLESGSRVGSGKSRTGSRSPRKIVSLASPRVSIVRAIARPHHKPTSIDPVERLSIKFVGVEDIDP